MFQTYKELRKIDSTNRSWVSLKHIKRPDIKGSAIVTMGEKLILVGGKTMNDEISNKVRYIQNTDNIHKKKNQNLI